MGEGSLLLRALHEHRDRRPNALIDEHHENLVLIAKENRVAFAYSGNGADLHFKNGLTHIPTSLVFPPKSEICFRAVTVTFQQKYENRKSRKWSLRPRYVCSDNRSMSVNSPTGNRSVILPEPTS